MDIMKDLTATMSQVESQIAKQGPPGPPPRPGLVWNPQSHRWVRPDSQQHTDAKGKEYSAAWHEGRSVAGSMLGEVERDHQKARQRGDNPSPLQEQIADLIRTSKTLEAQSPGDKARQGRERGKRDALLHRYNELTGRPPQTGRAGY